MSVLSLTSPLDLALLDLALLAKGADEGHRIMLALVCALLRPWINFSNEGLDSWLLAAPSTQNQLKLRRLQTITLVDRDNWSPVKNLFPVGFF